MNSIGKTIQCLRKAKGVTQESMAQQIGVSFQAISKWENDVTLPDILLLPVIADYFGVSIDELFQYQWNVMTSREKLASFMLKNGIITLGTDDPKTGTKLAYYVNTERFTTNMQLNAIGEVFAECLMDNHVAFDAVMGLAYHGISFAAATALSLQNKYGCTTHFCYDRQKPDSRGRVICGYTPTDGDRVVIVDDVIRLGKEIDERIIRLRQSARVQIAAIMVIADVKSDFTGRKWLESKYHTKVYSLLTDEDIRSAMKKGASPRTDDGFHGISSMLP